MAIQGVAGAFHDAAARKLLPGKHVQLVPCDSFAQVFFAVQNNLADYGVCAIENNIHGPINPVYRLLERHQLWIAGETTLHIEQYLIAHKQIPIKDLNQPGITIMSQAPALAQVEQWLDKHLPLAKRQESHDTADSVRTVVSKRSDAFAAIAGKHAAQLYKGTIVAGPINDAQHNYTRFVLLTKRKATPQNANRTSIILTTDHRPGALYTALGVFSQSEINLSKLDSHPITGDKRHYAFYIDLDTGLQNPKLQRAFQTLEHKQYKIKILGSYRHHD